MWIRDGRHDLRTNGIWIQHGWLGDDSWFQRNHRDKALFRSDQKVQELADLLGSHGVKYVFPHLCLIGQPAVIASKMARDIGPGSSQTKSDAPLLRRSGRRLQVDPEVLQPEGDGAVVGVRGHRQRLGGSQLTGGFARRQYQRASADGLRGRPDAA